jgi:Zn-dependent protease
MKSALPLFKFAGIQVYLHYLWFLVAFWEFSQSSRRYASPIWGIFEYLALMGIVLVHEFGHALACRQTGGQADTIMLWPLGGVAFVNPPQRPGAYLWSIAAGPLVNVVLIPVFTVALKVAAGADWGSSWPDAYRFIGMLWLMNVVLLIFNLLPIYPLDGGQLVRGLLWFWLGRIRSLRVASIIGLVGAVSIGLFALSKSWWWGVILAFFIFSQAQMGWRQARLLAATPPPANTPNA